MWPNLQGSYINLQGGNVGAQQLQPAIGYAQLQPAAWAPQGGGGGSVLQAATSNPGGNSYQAPAQSSGGGNGARGDDTGSIWYGKSSEPDYGPIRDSINSSYDSYFRELDSMVENLGNERAAQEGIVNNSYQQGVTDLNAANTDSMNTLGTQRRKTEENQTKNLRDLAGNLQSQYMAGNVYLGARGAADSSASNQYSYALNQVGSRARGDVMNNTANIMSDIGDREIKVKNVFTQEMTRLGTEKQNALLNLSAQFEQAQRQIKQMKATGQLSRGQDLAALNTNILNNAMQKMNQIENNFKSGQQMLTQWALSNSQNINQAKQNLQQMGSVAYNLPGFSPVNGQPQVDPFSGGGVAATGYGSVNNQTKLDIFGRPIQ